MLVVIGDGCNAHEPLVSDSANGWDTVFHGKMNIACSTQFALPFLLRGNTGRPYQALHYQIVGVVVPSPSRAEFREHASMFHQLYALNVRFLFLPFMTPVFVAEAKVRFTRESE